MQDHKDIVIRRPPSQYMETNVFATFLRDGLSKNVFPWWGTESCMWSNDFPRGNSTWPESVVLRPGG
ncbi:MAG TPA: hypothetical protein VNG12_08365 [Acidimicrobiales bacterium]|nr:hypothetical protein [Acidimicrobiales bacterium]